MDCSSSVFFFFGGETPRKLRKSVREAFESIEASFHFRDIFFHFFTAVTPWGEKRRGGETSLRFQLETYGVSVQKKMRRTEKKRKKKTKNFLPRSSFPFFDGQKTLDEVCDGWWREKKKQRWKSQRRSRPLFPTRHPRTPHHRLTPWRRRLRLSPSRLRSTSCFR